MRTTVDLPAELLRAAKARAAQRGESLGQLFARAIVHELGHPIASRKDSRVALPLVGRDAEARRSLTNADSEAILAADDAERYAAR